MKIRQSLCTILMFATLCSCNDRSVNTPDAIQRDGIVPDTSPVSIKVNSAPTVQVNNKEEADTITTITFKELALTINHFMIDSEAHDITHIQTDTITIFAEPGESIQGQLISVSGSELIDLVIEQRYETSVTVMNEGPHCDLREWKHYYSDWKPLQTNTPNQFIGATYSEKEDRKFPKISIAELKQKVKEHCGEEWLKLVEKVRMPTEYPCAVTISRYYLRLTGKHKANQQPVTKLIIIEAPMGC